MSDPEIEAAHKLLRGLGLPKSAASVNVQIRDGGIELVVLIEPEWVHALSSVPYAQDGFPVRIEERGARAHLL